MGHDEPLVAHVCSGVFIFFQIGLGKVPAFQLAGGVASYQILAVGGGTEGSKSLSLPVLNM